MVALLKRDFLISLTYVLTILILIPFVYAIHVSPLAIFTGTVIGLFAGLYYYDQQAGINKYLVSLPISRKTIINARYLFSVLLMIFTLTYIFLIDNFVHLFFPNYGAEPLPGELFFNFFCISVLIIAIYLPIYTKFNYMTAFIIQLVSMFLVPMILIMIMTWLLEISKFGPQINELIEFLLQIYSANPLVVSIVSVGLILFISWSISQRIYSRKDF